MTAPKKGTAASVRLTAAAGLLAATLALGACSDFSRFELASPAAVTQPQRPVRAAPAQQTAAALREHDRILSSYGGVYEDARLSALISRAVDRLVAASDRPDLTYKVTILNSSAVNAFALPTGQLYITRGLIALASDTSELSSVLAHEMAHVIARHAAIREDRARQDAIVSRVVSEIGDNPDLTALALARSKLSLASFSRVQEFEADGIGVGIAARAGFDPFGAVRFLTSMERNAALRASRSAADPRSLDFLSSHPATPERVQNAQTHARQFSSPGSGERDRDDYLNALDEMIYGEDPSEGFVRGRRFIHPKLGFTFTAPDGFSLDNTAQAVIGVREGGAQAMRFDVARVSSEQSLRDYLTSGWIDDVDRSTVEDVTVNGFPAATAIAQGEQWRFRIYALRFGSDVYRFVFASKQKNAQGDRAFRETINTFRRLTLAEIQAARPLRLKIITVQPGDTVETLSHRMAGVDRQLARFRMLNGLDANATVKPRDRVKIVVE